MATELFRAPNGVVVRANIVDRTGTGKLQPRTWDIVRGMASAAPAAGIAIIDITAGAGGGHKSHGAGTEVDIKGYTADGQLWSPEQRVAIAQGARQAGADRFGMYGFVPGKLGNGTLHVGYSGKGRPAAIWGAYDPASGNNLTSGDKSRAFTNPAEQAFLAGTYQLPDSPATATAFNPDSVSPTTAKLAGVMLAEARGEGREGMAGVGNVVINRTNTPGARFPKTIDEAINSEFAKPLGPNDVSPEQWQEAVELAMGLQAGVVPDNTGGAVYFANPATSQTSAYNLIKASGPVTTTIGNHVYHAGSVPPAPRQSPVANIVQARDAVQPNMAVRPPTEVAPPPVMTPTPPPFNLEGSGTASQPNMATAIGVMPPAMPTPRMRPGGANAQVSPPPTMVSTPPPFELTGGATTSQGSSASAVGTMPPAVPSPRPRPDNNYFDIDEATRVDENGNYLSTGESPGVPTPAPRPNMSIAPPPSPLKASEPAVRPIPASMAVEAPPAPSEKQEPSGVTFVTPASIQNLGPIQAPSDLKAGTASESITSPMSVIEAAIQDFDAATPPQGAPVMAPAAAAMRPPTPPVQAAPTNMATAPPASGATIKTTQAPSMATASPGGGWFSKLFTPNTGGSKGFSQSGGGVSPSGLAYRTGTGMGGNPALQWTNSKGQTVTVVQNGFGQPGYSTGFG